MNRKLTGLGALALLIAVAAYVWLGRDAPSTGAVPVASGGAMVAVSVPALSGKAVLGKAAFKARCAACHGPDAGGIEGAGPPLIHKIYEPGHHGDMAFVLAARRGVKSHHWRFGDMPPVADITDAEIASIVVFVRTVQQANGIF